MAKTILEIAVSLDGYIADPHDGLDWLEPFDNLSEYGFDEFIPTVGAIVVGKRSYDFGVEQEWFKHQTYGPSPLFVVCSEAPSSPSDDADFRFVTSGLEEAYKQASETAGDKNVYVFGGAHRSAIAQSGSSGRVASRYSPRAPGSGGATFRGPRRAPYPSRTTRRQGVP